MRTFGLLLMSFITISVAFGQQQATPIASIPVGDSPFASALTPDNTEAVVLNLFPVMNADGTNGPNLRVIDLVRNTQIHAFQVGTRLVAIQITGTTALIVNEDQDALRVVDINTGTELATIPVGSRPSNVVVLNATTAMVTNGTSGDLSFIDIPNRKVVGTALAVGTDPRSAALNPVNSRYAYVALGGENNLAVLDLQSSPVKVVTKVATGKDPVAVKVTADGHWAVTANLNSNTVSIFDVTNPAAPAWVESVPVGSQPSQIAVNPRTPNIVYVANLASSFFSVVDVTKTQNTALTGIVPMTVAASGIQVNNDATRLYVTEFSSSANLRVYDLANMPLSAPPMAPPSPRPVIDLPGEPRLISFLNSTGSCASSFYIAQSTLASAQKEGVWGMEVLVSEGQLSGGFNLGGALEANGGTPGFGAFSIASPQTIGVSIAAQPLSGTAASLQLTANLLDSSGATVQTVAGAPPLNFNTASLAPGFYIIAIRTGAGSPRATFQLGLAATAFSGGVVVGGFTTQGVTGFGGFCLPTSQKVDMRLAGVTDYGSAAAGDQILTLSTLVNGTPTTVRTVNNGIVSSAPVTPPPAPSISGVGISYYVDASGQANGTGTSASPFKSITSAMKVAKSADVVYVRPGRYSPSLTGETIPIAPPAGVTLIGAGADISIIDAENFAGANAVVMAGAGARFAGFTVTRSSQAGLYTFNANNLVIENNLFTSNQRFGVGGQGSSGLVVRNNVAVSNLETGIAFAGSLAAAGVNVPANCAAASPGSMFGAYIVNNVAQDNRADGILISAGGTACVADNTVNDNGSSGIEFNNRAGDAPSPPLNGSIVNNKLSGNGGVQFAFAGTGILVTEGATADVISGNLLSSNRPFGIGVFLNGGATLISKNTVTGSTQQGILVQRQSTVAEISDNSVTNNALTGLFVDDHSNVTRFLRNISTNNATGMSILDGSQTGTVDGNKLDQNSDIGLSLSSGTALAVTNNSLTGNGGGVFMTGSTLGSFDKNTVQQSNGSYPGISVGGGSATISNSAINGNASGGVSAADSAHVQVQSSTINSNSGFGGVSASNAATISITGSTISGNTPQGVIASGAGSVLTLAGGNTVSNSGATGGSGGYGIVSTAGGTTTCAGTNTFSNNPAGNFGPATGCQ